MKHLYLGLVASVLALVGDYSYWRALNNRYWPAFYLVDADGKIVKSAFGELHRGDRRGDAMEAAIREQLHN